jgi:magnesium chelatase family protein
LSNLPVYSNTFADSKIKNMLVKTYGCAVCGIDAIKITVEVNLVQGKKFYMVGLPDNAVKESWFRIIAAAKNVGHRIPVKRTTINLAPADIKKEGSAYDLTIAIGMLAAAQEIPDNKVGDYVIMGELALDGILRPIKGALSIAFKAKEEGFKGVILPMSNINEVAIVDGIEILGAESLIDVIEFFNDKSKLENFAKPITDFFQVNDCEYDIDFADVKGQENVKRALEISAAGGHNVILIGPPGSGKSMLAKRMPTILPPLTVDEALETTKIHSVAGILAPGSGLVSARPFRSPHHTSSGAALAGGGSNPKPGEISLAHNGILFLDELPEFNREVLEVMRQPLEDRVVTISRARATVDYPAGFMLVAAMNPSPSGEFYNPNEAHADTEFSVQRYLNKISGPLMDRIDLHIEVNPVPYDKLASKMPGEASKEIRKRVMAARLKQLNRYKEYPGIHNNAQMTPKLQEEHCKIDEKAQELLKTAMERLGMSARSYGRIFKVARTIADLGNDQLVGANHIAEAIQYRTLDRDNWLTQS